MIMLIMITHFSMVNARAHIIIHINSQCNLICYDVIIYCNNFL
jgi:hypothetical protein